MVKSPNAVLCAHPSPWIPAPYRSTGHAFAGIANGLAKADVRGWKWRRTGSLSANKLRPYGVSPAPWTPASAGVTNSPAAGVRLAGNEPQPYGVPPIGLTPHVGVRGKRTREGR